VLLSVDLDDLDLELAELHLPPDYCFQRSGVPRLARRSSVWYEQTQLPLND
jgi:hypothetical protein